MKIPRIEKLAILLISICFVLSAVTPAFAESLGSDAIQFAENGSEKMIYDVRMGPQAILHRGTIHIVYQADPESNLGNPHLISYDTTSRQWTAPQKLGTVTRYDHHFAPIIWLDRDRYFHILYGCHGGPGKHLVAEEQESVTSWREAEPLAKSISYPTMFTLPRNRQLLYFRVFGHMGYWTYSISPNGASAWMQPDFPVTDFDRDPQRHLDPYAGSYHSARLSPDGKQLHIAFVYKDDSSRPHPLYESDLAPKDKRYNLYYCSLDLESGELFTVEGKKLSRPVTRHLAEECMVLDSEYRLTNMPSIALDETGEPAFMVPVSGTGPADFTFYFVVRQDGKWQQYPIVRTNSSWSGSLLRNTGPGQWKALLAVGRQGGTVPHYGGGELQEWSSSDDGRTWKKTGNVNSQPGLLYNSPKPVITADGRETDKWIVFWGWPGEAGIQERIRARPNEQHNIGKAFLYEWR